MVQPYICPSCQKEVNFNFCPNCGQKKITKRLQFTELIFDFFKGVLELETPFFKTIKVMTLRPHEVIHHYIIGARNKYSTPLNYAIIMVAFYFVVCALWDVNYEILLNQFFMDINIDMAVAKNELDMEFNHLLYGNLKQIQFINMLFLGWFIWFGFKKSGYNFAETLVLVFYAEAQLLFFCSLVVPFYSFFPTSVVILHFFVFEFVFFVWCIYKFYKINFLKVILRFSMIYVLSTLTCYTVTSFMIILWLVSKNLIIPH